MGIDRNQVWDLLPVAIGVLCPSILASPPLMTLLNLCLLLPVENPAHCDFVKLRTMLVRTHMQDLKDVTRETHYENYRAQYIQSMTRMVVKERNRKYVM